jgi:hypothetical protein
MYSVLCPGLEVAASGTGAQLTLLSVTREDNSKWSFLSDGSIESIKTGTKVEIVRESVQFVQVKLQQTTGDYINVFEVEVFDSTGTINVARGKLANASSVYGGETPQKAVDGDLTTLFHSKSKNDGDANPWLHIDLGASCRGCKIVIHNRDVDTCGLSYANLMLYDGSGNVVKTINVGNTCGRAILEYDKEQTINDKVVGFSIILGGTYKDKDIGAVGIRSDTTTTITGDDIKVTGSGSGELTSMLHF